MPANAQLVDEAILKGPMRRLLCPGACGEYDGMCSMWEALQPVAPPPQSAPTLG
jgi:hypothetical protein